MARLPPPSTRVDSSVTHSGSCTPISGQRAWLSRPVVSKGLKVESTPACSGSQGLPRHCVRHGQPAESAYHQKLSLPHLTGANRRIDCELSAGSLSVR